MSLINDQVRALRDVAQEYSNNGLEKILNAAADTIEELSENWQQQTWNVPMHFIMLVGSL